jgi:DNA-binding transcriptional ArsR family regulator
VAGFWKAPRALARLLAERELTPNAYTLLHVAAESGADRADGITTTVGSLAAALGVSERTIYRALRLLRELRLLAYADHRGVAPFALRTVPATLLALEKVGHTSDTPLPPETEVLSEVGSDTRVEAPTRNPALEAASSAAEPLTLARARGDRDQRPETARFARYARAHAREAASERTIERPKVKQGEEEQQ